LPRIIAVHQPIKTQHICARLPFQGSEAQEANKIFLYAVVNGNRRADGMKKPVVRNNSFIDRRPDIKNPTKRSSSSLSSLLPFIQISRNVLQNRLQRFSLMKKIKPTLYQLYLPEVL
jgi:hypothetical protein